MSTTQTPSLTLTLIHPNGKVETKNPEGDEWTLEELQATIGGGYIETVPVGETESIAIIDEEGLLKKLPFNIHASRRVGMPVHGIVAIGHGSVIK